MPLAAAAAARPQQHARTHPAPPCPRSLYNNIKTPGQLSPNATYYLFKEGIEPKWEDPKNAKGGVWTASIPTNKGDPKKVVDAWWLNSVRDPESGRLAGGGRVGWWCVAGCARDGTGH